MWGFDSPGGVGLKYLSLKFRAKEGVKLLFPLNLIHFYRKNDGGVLCSLALEPNITNTLVRCNQCWANKPIEGIALEASCNLCSTKSIPNA